MTDSTKCSILRDNIAPYKEYAIYLDFYSDRYFYISLIQWIATGDLNGSKS